MKQSRVLAACVPESFGGVGVESLHDYSLGISRLGRGCASIAIATNMHAIIPWRLTRSWQVAKAEGVKRRVERLETSLRQVAAGEVVMCVPVRSCNCSHPMKRSSTLAKSRWG